MASRDSLSRLERIGGPCVLLLVAAYAVFVGARALVLGEFLASGSRANPSLVAVLTGARAYTSGAFVFVVGITLLVVALPRRARLKSPILRALLALNGVLFLVAVGAFALA